eukprot:1091401-Pyramimonas_sp.AAC.1
MGALLAGTRVGVAHNLSEPGAVLLLTKMEEQSPIRLVVDPILHAIPAEMTCRLPPYLLAR